MVQKGIFHYFILELGERLFRPNSVRLQKDRKNYSFECSFVNVYYSNTVLNFNIMCHYQIYASNLCILFPNKELVCIYGNDYHKFMNTSYVNTVIHAHVNTTIHCSMSTHNSVLGTGKFGLIVLLTSIRNA